ncbi:MAG: peptidase dimerization domain-containing protein, partial [Kiritimatiellae bacterium]|nr:peptidase dimerization domain-containing protein [Kiritimatiellia bacterium]
PDGGDAPNVVPAHATAWYYVRGKDRAQVDAVRERLIACAKGAAMATGTRVRWKRLTGVYERLRNDVLADALLENLKLFGPPKPTAADIRNAKRLGKKPEFATEIKLDVGGQGRASSDEDNVSWLVPFGGELKVACVAKGTTGHHREYAAQCVLPFAHRGMLRAAEVLAATTFDLCANPRLLRRARAEFLRRTRGFTYDPLVAPHQKPPVASRGFLHETHVGLNRC